MKIIHRFFLISFFSICLPLFGQTNLIKNTSFIDSSNFDLKFYGTAKGSSSISAGVYAVNIDSCGTELWNVQLIQSKLRIDSGAIYRFSFDALASQPRSIEASISKDQGDYISYSGRDTISLTKTAQKFEYTFSMKLPTDTSARVEFNLGKYYGSVSLSNIELVKIPGPYLAINQPEPGKIWFEGSPISLSWISAGISGALKIDLSTDYGLNWVTVGASVPDTGSYIWTPKSVYSPWCLLRISSIVDPKTFSTTKLPFEIVPRIELIQNGDFSKDGSMWNLGVYGNCRASGSVTTDGFYKIKIDTAGTEKWHAQFTQAGISLQTGISYTLSFIAYADRARTIRAEINENGGAYECYIDNTQHVKELTNVPQLFTINFTMNKDTDLNARLEINCGLDDADVFIGNLSLTKTYTAKMKNSRTASSLRTANNQKVAILRNNKLVAHGRKISPNSLIDLLGRPSVNKGKMMPHNNTIHIAPGLYISTQSAKTIR